MTLPKEQGFPTRLAYHHQDYTWTIACPWRGCYRTVYLKHGAVLAYHLDESHGMGPVSESLKPPAPPILDTNWYTNLATRLAAEMVDKHLKANPYYPFMDTDP